MAWRLWKISPLIQAFPLSEQTARLLLPGATSLEGILIWCSWIPIPGVPGKVAPADDLLEAARRAGFEPELR